MTTAGGCLAADLGGTRTRFLACLPDGSLHHLELSAADHGDADSAISAALSALGLSAAGTDAVLAAAGPVRDGVVRFTNLDWSLDARALRERFGFRRVTLLNDVEAAARAAAEAPGERRVFVSVGTGLGVAYWRGTTVDATEAGHLRFPAPDGLQRRLHDRLVTTGEVEWEQVVSGPGLSALDALERGRELAPAEVTRRAGEGDDRASLAVERFCELLGAFSAELVLAGPAPGGVLLGGGVLSAIGGRFDVTAFNRRFVGGRMHALLAQVPVWRTADTHLALRGALAVAME